MIQKKYGFNLITVRSGTSTQMGLYVPSTNNPKAFFHTRLPFEYESSVRDQTKALHKKRQSLVLELLCFTTSPHTSYSPPPMHNNKVR